MDKPKLKRLRTISPKPKLPTKEEAEEKGSPIEEEEEEEEEEDTKVEEHDTDDDSDEDIDIDDVEKDRYKKARLAAEEGKFDSIPADLYIKYYKNYCLMYVHQRALVYWEPLAALDNYWFVGPTGTGKSLTACKENEVHYAKDLTDRWDGYKDEPCVIIDNWSPRDLPMITYLKAWGDHHAFRARIKGGYINIRPKKIIVTSNYSIKECSGGNDGPLERRFKERVFK
jgi:hypothetical protein